MKISEIITDKYKLRIPPTVYYDLLADVVEAEEDQEPCNDANANQHNSNALKDVGQHTNALEWDAISRQAVLDCQHFIYDETGEELEVILAENVLNLPSVNPQEPKTGHWKRISIDLYVQHATAYYKCSECGEKVIGKHNYCPNCGARMQESEEV